MKKILLTCLMLVCCLFSFTSCDNLSGEYWKDTQVSLTEVFESDNYKAVQQIDFSNNLDTIIASNYGGAYSELTSVLVPLFDSSISYAYNHYNDLLMNPEHNNDNFKKAIKVVNGNTQTFSAQLKNFVQKKNVYESHITFTNEAMANSDIELTRLLLFKREFITLIESAYNLSESLFNARRAGYYDFSDYSDESVELIDKDADCSLAINMSNLEITKCAINVVKTYNAKSEASNYENYTNAANNFYTNVVKAFNEKQLTTVENVKEEMVKWQSVNSMFSQECTKFVNILQNINVNLLTECNNSAKLYAESTQNADDEIYINYYLNFYNNINTLSTYCLNLFN